MTDCLFLKYQRTCRRRDWFVYLFIGPRHFDCFGGFKFYAILSWKTKLVFWLFNVNEAINSTAIQKMSSVCCAVCKRDRFLPGLSFFV